MSDARTDLLALKARVDAATGPDRGLDADIWDAIDNRKRVVPAYTASVDAALALIERVLPEWQVVHFTKGWRGPGKLFDELPETLRAKYAKAALEVATVATVKRSEYSYVEGKAEHTTPALALVSALLAALIAQQEDRDGR